MRNSLLANSLTLLALAAAVAGCDVSEAPRKPGEDAKDIAMVERMSREPFKPIVPAEITPLDVDRYGLDRPGCSFYRPGGRGPLLIAGKADGYMRIGGELKRYAAKAESAELPAGARSTYVGLAGWVDLARLPDKGTSGTGNSWPARLILHDAQERIAFSADGTVRCTT